MNTDNLDNLDVDQLPDGDPVEPHEMLAEVLPGIMKEGAVLVEFKTNTPTTVGTVTSAILTLHPEECPIDQCPDDTDPNYIWCWDLSQNTWFQLDFKQVETAQTWPPEDPSAQ
jgi:hypothetical protein